MPNVTVVSTTAQYEAIRKLSLKYEGVSVQQMAEKLFRQVVRNYFKTELKQLAQKSGAQWDAATKLGFDTKLTREEYVNRSVKEARATWRELNGAANVFSFDADDEMESED